MKSSNIRDESRKLRTYSQEEIDSLDPSYWGDSPLFRDDGVRFISTGTSFVANNKHKIDTGVGVFDADVALDIQRAASENQLLDFVMLADSNAIATGGGWLYGVLEGIGHNLNYELYATPLLSAVENEGNGFSIGTDRSYASIPSGAIGAQSGAPQFCEDQFVDLSISNAYSYIAAGNAADTFFNFKPGSYKSVSGDPWTVRLNHATFATGGGVITTDVRLGTSPWTQLVADEAVDCDTGKDGFQIHDQKFNCSFPNDSIAQEYRLKAATLKSFSSYVSAFKSDAVKGFSCSLLGGFGGWQIGGKIADITTAGSFYQNRLLTTLRENVGVYFVNLRERQITLGKSPKICIILSFGMNDRSVNSIEEVKEKTALTIEFLKSAYIMGGGRDSELSFIIMSSHRISDLEGTDDQDKLTAYSIAADELAMEISRTASINLNTLFTEAEAIDNGWYESEISHYHLSNVGNAALWARGLEQVFKL